MKSKITSCSKNSLRFSTSESSIPSNDGTSMTGASSGYVSTYVNCNVAQTETLRNALGFLSLIVKLLKFSYIIFLLVTEAACHLQVNPLHSLRWRILCMAQSATKSRILQGLFIQQWKLSLNRQGHCFIDKLFPHCNDTTQDSCYC